MMTGSRFPPLFERAVTEPDPLAFSQRAPVALFRRGVAVTRLSWRVRIVTGTTCRKQRVPRSTQQPAHAPAGFMGLLSRAAVRLVSGTSLMCRILSTRRASASVPLPWVCWPATLEEILGLIERDCDGTVTACYGVRHVLPQSDPPLFSRRGVSGSADDRVDDSSRTA